MNDRLEVLRSLLLEGRLSTQDELRMKLEKQKFRVTQSTISRDLRRIGAVRAVDGKGNTVYRLPDGSATDNVASMAVTASPEVVVRTVQSNGSVLVIRTIPGLASMVARHIDMRRPPEFLGTIAGEDTIFVALSEKGARSADGGVAYMREILSELE
ncbi:MAG TPA: arginine repressor [Bdellovibrionota bacterium]|jgi:transcriptional regulator of arginine metabolism